MADNQNHLPDHLVVQASPATPSHVSLTSSTATATATTSAGSGGPPRPRKPTIHDVYCQPAPLRTFPFPMLTSNPVSWIHLAVVWLSQVLSPPPTEPSVIHTAYWDVATRSIIVTDEKSMADLWQQGFYGKGNLSRSEPNWLKREQIRRGVANGRVSEVNTDKRREDRARVKWERARAEEEARERQRSHEAHLLAEVGVAATADAAAARPAMPLNLELSAPVGPLELLAMPNSIAELAARSRLEDSVCGTDASVDESGLSGNDDADSNTTVSSDSARLKRRKSVRFSPHVESTVFQHTDPPSPPHSVSSSSLKSNGVALALEHSVQDTSDMSSSQLAAEAVEAVEIAVVSKEHLQLAPQEALFLAFALGSLKIVDTVTQAIIPTADLLTLLRQYSYYPPRMSQTLQPDDPFLTHYAVYHHFRSLGWVPRPGVKFGVDWLLYNRGPVFDHAEYGLLVLPSYSHPYWKAEGRQGARKSWHWLMGVNRVLSKVFKSLVLVYVDVPPPTAFSESSEIGLLGALKQYRIREQMVKRWSSNRNRDLK
ncbi:unnamed protein product [Discula destructiva]